MGCKLLLKFYLKYQRMSLLEVTIIFPDELCYKITDVWDTREQLFWFVIQKRTRRGTPGHLSRLLVQFLQSNSKESCWGLLKWSRHFTKSEWIFWWVCKEVKSQPGGCAVHCLGWWPDKCPQPMEHLRISPGPQNTSPCWLALFLPCPGWAAASWPSSRNQFLPDIVWGCQQLCLGQEGRR